MGLCASTLGGPVTTGRHGTRRPQAREGPPAVSVKTRHFASRPPPPAIPVFPLPTRAGSHAQALARARGPTLSRCSTTGLAPERDPLSLSRSSSFRARALSSRSPPRSTRESSLPRPYRPFLRRTRVAAGAPIPHTRARTRAIANRSTGDLHIDGKTNLPVV